MPMRLNNAISAMRPSTHLHSLDGGAVLVEVELLGGLHSHAAFDITLQQAFCYQFDGA
jgi:hypothetical protein